MAKKFTLFREMKTPTILSLLLCATLTLEAQTNGVQPRALSLEECIAIALEHNLTIQITRYNPMIASYSLAGIYGDYEPTLSLSSQHDYSLSPGGVDAEGRGFVGTETEVDRIGGGLQGLLPWGTTYNLGASFSDRTDERPDTDPNFNLPLTIHTNQYYDLVNNQPVTELITNYASIPSRPSFETTSGQVGALTLRQPLLKNFWIDGIRLNIFVSKRDLVIRESDFRDQVMTTVTAVEDAYLNLIFSEESVKVQEKALELAERLLAENKRRVQVGALAPLDEKQAESQVASSRADLLSAQAQRDTQQRVLKALLSDDYTNEWASLMIVPTDKLLAVAQLYDLQESWRRGLSQGPRLSQARLALEQQRQRVRFQRNQLYPQLDLVGSFGYSAGGAARNYSDALDQISGRDNSFWSFGAQMTIPLGQTTARNSLKAAKAAQEQLALTLKQQEQQTLILIENAIANAQSSFERVDATRQFRLYAQAALEAEQKKLESGKSTSFVVLQLQKDLTDASSAEIRALADYNIALANLALAEGSTFERRKINLEIK
jgi:outer membrane protein TolC